MMKYAAAILTVLALAGTAWAVVAATRPVPGGVPAPGAAAELNQQLKVCDGEVLHLRGLDKTIDKVDRLTIASQPQAAMLAVYDSKTQASALARSKSGHQADKPVISLVYVSPDLQKVVINGSLLGVGDKMPGGGRLVAIAQDRIKYVLKGKSQALLVPEPHVLGMAAAPKNAN